LRKQQYGLTDANIVLGFMVVFAEWLLPSFGVGIPYDTGVTTPDALEQAFVN
jgi:hypothetical protein